ncbi:hydantoinase/oxoprolinase family protein, partial [Hypericibacter sp.]|uniref:hydantoinase/oxoprolinase family protein n=1 Tax=Hypericibacter sp. TaxID=2705401 RepID=UPI003D6CDBF1
MQGGQFDIGIDVGGTFTDVVMVGAGGELQVVKGLTTPDDQSIGAVDTVAMLNQPMAQLRSIIHGTTVATNAILERKGARTALVTTRGFRDVLELQRQDRDNIWDLFSRKVEALVPRCLRFEIDERIMADGRIEHPLEETQFAALAKQLTEAGAQAVVIAFLNAYANPAHEQRVEALLSAALPGVYVVRSSRIAPHFREYERTSTTAISAYVGPKISGYLSRFRGRFVDRGFGGEIFVMGSGGGVLPLDTASQYAATTCLSGPAGGVLATTRLAKEKALPNLISFDMGGTSTDVCLLADSHATTSTRARIDGLPISLPMFAIETVSAGGGSIASIDAGGLLRVGPRSAGSKPGPACYGRGGKEPTVTDALCLVGLLRAESFFGGRMQLDLKAAETALAPVATQLGDKPADAAAKVLTIANIKMANTVRMVAVREGRDARDFAIVAFGGAGPLHACQVAEELNITHVVVPQFPGAFSAYGLLSADLKRDYMRTRITPLSRVEDETLRGWLKELQDEASAEMAAIASGRQIYWRYQLDLRYAGQASELVVPLTNLARLKRSTVIGLFHKLHADKYGFADRDAEVELVNLRLEGYATVEPPAMPPAEKRRVGAPRGESHPVSLPGAGKCLFLRREELLAGDQLEGPAVV